MYKLIMLPNPILVSDEKISHDYDKPMWNVVHNKVFTRIGVSLMQDFKKIIAGVEGLPKLDLSDIAEEIGWVDVEKLAYQKFKMIPSFNNGLIVNSDTNYFERKGWIDGFKAAQSLNEKKFSEEELKDALFYALSIKSETCCTTNTKDSTVRSTIKSLSKPKEYNVEVDMEDIGNKDKVYNCSSKSEWIPKITNNTIKILRIL